MRLITQSGADTSSFFVSLFRCAVCCILAFMGVQVLVAAPSVLSGRVLDPSGRAIAGARVTLQLEKGAAQLTTTGTAGDFSFTVEDFKQAHLLVTHRGFAPASVSLSGSDDQRDIEIKLALANLSDAVVVTATAGTRPTSAAGSAASITVIEGDRIIESAERVVDDLLRARVPGFSLFRRSSSLAANPTSQGVSLRGTGASGASRSLVLDDGIPAGDPFGGWIYWSRLPRARIGGIEVVRGSSSDSYGSSAMGGVIGIQSRPIMRQVFITDAALGNLRTADLSLFAGHASGSNDLRGGSWGGGLVVDASHSEGYIPVARAERGVVDTPAGGWHRTIEAMVERKFRDGIFGSGARLFVRGQLFGERRENGTPLQTNSTASGMLVAGGQTENLLGGSWRFRLYAGTQGYDQAFSAIAATRSAESLARLQRVPARQRGASLVWWSAPVDRVITTAGMEARRVQGFSDEIIFDSAGRPATNTVAGGIQDTVALFGNMEAAIFEKVQVTAAARFDTWNNHDASSRSRSLTVPNSSFSRVTLFASERKNTFSPRLAAVWKESDRFSLRASVGRSFRAPTLNELYRDFRVGNVLTLGNPGLEGEKAATGEAGALWTSPGRRLSLRATGFVTVIEDPIANVTLSATPTLITRQRKNLGRSRSRGIEAETEYRPADGWFLAFSYLLVDARVRDFPAEPLLLNARLPQIPRHALTFEASYQWRRLLSAGFMGRYNSASFEDDRNLLLLGSYFIADLYLSRPLRPGLDLYIAAENLFDREYAVGRTPATTVGSPRMVRVGLRARFGGS